MRAGNSPETQEVINYTLAALVGMLAGFIIGCLFGAPRPGPSAPPAPHPRALESPP